MPQPKTQDDLDKLIRRTRVTLGRLERLAERGAVRLDLDEALALCRQGKTIRELGRRYGVSGPWLYKRLVEMDPLCCQKSMQARRDLKAGEKAARTPYVPERIMSEEGIRAAREAWIGGTSLRALGRRYGLSGERVRQVLEQAYPGIGEKANAARMERSAALKASRAAEQESRRIEAEKHAPPCAVCLRTNIRAVHDSRVITCSPGCAEAWRILRYYLDEDYAEIHRKNMADWILRQPEGAVNPTQIRYAERVRSGQIGPLERYGVQPGSKSEELLRKYRPELLAELQREQNV
jgi:lambda repressor-like predicted transcriptional regulator